MSSGAKYRGRLFAAWALGLWLLLLPVYAFAGGQRQIAFALDDSGSMRHTDPNELSKQAGEIFVRLMDAETRLAVLPFATEARVALPMTAMSSDAVKQRAREIIMALARRGNRTNIESVLAEGLRHFSQTDGMRAMLLLSDGHIDFDDDPKVELPEERASRERIMGELAAEYAKQKIPIYAIAFGTDADDDLLKRLARLSGGLFFRIETEREVAPVYFKIFNQIEKPQLAPISDGTFTIDETIREATLIVESPKDVDAIVIVDPKGRRYRRTKPTSKVRWGGNDAYLLATVVKPRPGTWAIKGFEKTGGKVIVLTDVKLRVPEPRGLFASDEPIYVLAKMDLGPDNPRLPIDMRMRAELVDPTGMVIETIPLANDGQGKAGCEDARQVDRLEDDYFSGLFKGVEGRRPGLYSLRIIAEADTFTRQREYTVRIGQELWLELNADELKPSPQNSLTIPFTFSSDILAHPGYRLHDANQTLPANINLSDAFHVRVQDPEGEWVSANVRVEQDKQRLLVLLEKPAVEGEYLVEIDAVANDRALVCFQMGRKFTVDVRFPAEVAKPDKPIMGMIGWIGMFLGMAIVVVLVVLVHRKHRQSEKALDDALEDNAPAMEPEPKPKKAPKPEPEMEDFEPEPMPEAFEPKPEPEPEPEFPKAPEPIPAPEMLGGFEDEPEADEPEQEAYLPEEEPDEPEEEESRPRNENQQSLDDLMAQMAALESDEPEPPKPEESEEEPEEDAEPEPEAEPSEDPGEDEPDDEQSPPESDEPDDAEAPAAEPEYKQVNNVADGVDLSEIEDIISKMDALAGGDDEQGEDTVDVPEDDGPSLDSLMDGSTDRDEESRRSALSRKEYDAIDKAIDKMQRIASLREITEAATNPKKIKKKPKEGEAAKEPAKPKPEPSDDE